MASKVKKVAKATPEEVAKKGGLARAEKLAPDQRTAIAKKAALARWGEKPLRATHGGTFRIGEAEFPCAVLENGMRVLTQRSVQKGLGMSTSGGSDGAHRVARFIAKLEEKGVETRGLSLRIGSPVVFQLPTWGKPAYGYEATVLADICDAILAARKAGHLATQQAHIATQCEVLVRGLARVGIIALVDEATGYQDIRDRQALQTILDAFLRKEFAAWAKRFPDGFYEQIFRLRGWTWRGMKVNRPHAVAHYTKDIVYARLAPGILTELEARNPAIDGRRARKHHQFLTDDLGHPALSQHIYAVVGFMRASRTWEQFMDLLNLAFPKRGDTLSFEFMADPPKALPSK